MKPTFAAALLVAILAAVPACYGSYSAFHKVHAWNGKVTANKWANSAIHLGLWIVPVYPLVVTGDFLIFNTVEHLTDKPVF